MDLKKSLFGGYNKGSVDAAIKQLKENEEQNQAKIALLDNEFRLSKETSQKNLESIQTELVIKQKSLSDLARTMDEKNTRIADLEERKRTIAAEFERQYGAIIAEMKQKNDAALAELEEKYSAKIAGLQERSRQETVLVRQNDDQVRKIGQLYVDAQEYTEKMKAEAKERMMESIDKVFGDLGKTQERFEASFAQINQKKTNLSRLAGEMQESLRALQNKMSSMDNEPVNFTSSFENIKYAKEQIKQSIQYEYDNDREKNNKKEPPLQKSEPAEERTVFTKSPVIAAWKQPAEPVEPSVDYAAQIEALKQKIDRQERLLSLRNTENYSASEPAAPGRSTGLPESAATEETPLVDRESTFIETPVDERPPEESKPLEEAGLPREDRVFVPAKEEESSVRNDKDLSERENYNRYFEEIRKKYSKEQLSAPSESMPAESASEPPVEPGMTEESKEKADKDNGENPVSKKPSIKDILNKYANMK